METRICVVGIWHLGAVTAACLADLGYTVVGVDDDAAKVKALNDGVPPLHEPGLEELMGRNIAAGRLRFATDLRQGVEGAQYVFISYDTPVDESDEVDLSPILAAARQLAACIEQESTLIVSSQVPVGTCEGLAGDIRCLNPQLQFGLACVPENLRLGQALERYRRPDMLVIGAEDGATAARVEALFSFVDAPKLITDLRTAEMTKHAINAYLATNISFINELANLCDRAGVDAFKVAQALKLDGRVSTKAPLTPGLGFAGGTLARDLRALRHLAEEAGYPGHLLRAVLSVNEQQNGVLVKKLGRALGSLAGRRIGVLGLTYKPGTSTLRRSAALEVIQAAVAAGATVAAHDPKADPSEISQHGEFAFFKEPHEAARGADAIVLMTAWPEFRQLDFRQMLAVMRGDVLVDGQNLLEPEAMVRLGFRYVGMGRGGEPTP